MSHLSLQENSHIRWLATRDQDQNHRTGRAAQSPAAAGARGQEHDPHASEKAVGSSPSSEALAGDHGGKAEQGPSKPASKSWIASWLHAT